jgi:hypothetical protein
MSHRQVGHSDEAATVSIYALTNDAENLAVRPILQRPAGCQVEGDKLANRHGAVFAHIEAAIERQLSVG